MRKANRSWIGILAAACLLASGVAIAEDKDTGWKDTAELSFVLTSGNSDSSSLGFKNTLSRAWDKSEFNLKAGGIRVETTTAKFAVGDPGTFGVTQIEEVTAESYYLNARYGRKITDRFFWYLGAGWDRNEFSGIENRYIGEAGVGNIWRDTEDLKFRTGYAATYTKQEDLVELPDVEDNFIGARFSWAYLNKLTENTTYENVFVADANLDESDDWRGDMINSLAVAMNKRMALKLSLQLLYDNMPSFETLPLFDPGDLTTPIGTVAVELDELDTIFTASLVVNF